MSSDDLIPRQRLLTMQIVASALPLGVIIFFGIVMFLVYGRDGAAAQQPSLPLISAVAAIFFIMTGSMSFVVPHFLTQTGLKNCAAGSGTGDVAALLNLRQATLIVGLALLEGAAFFGLVAFLIERQPLVLIVPGLCLVGMLSRFPTESKVRNWLELHGRRVLELRQDRPGSV